jgi:hypothetical protein
MDPQTVRMDGVPRQLPLPVRDFVGRAAELATLDAALSGGVPIAGVAGTAGVGKTTLAVLWAHRRQQQFPGGTLYANLRGYGPGTPATPAEVLTAFLGMLGMSSEKLPATEGAQASLYRSMLADRRVLIVLDNVSSVDQVRPLLPGTQGCLVLVTSRTCLSSR